MESHANKAGPASTHSCRMHFALAVLYNVYAMCILFWHFRRYVIIRQTYLTRGESRGDASWDGGVFGPLPFV